MRHHRPIRYLGVVSTLGILAVALMPVAAVGATCLLRPARPQVVFSLSAISPSSPPTGTTPAASATAKTPPPASGYTSPFPGDWSQLLPTLIATFLGAGLALITAIWVARVSDRRTKIKEEQADKNRLRKLLGQVSSDIDRNRREMSEALSDLESNLVTDRAPVFDIWRSDGPEILGTSREAGAEIAEAYALLGRFARLLHQYLDEVNRGAPYVQSARTETLSKLRTVGSEAALALDVAAKRAREEIGTLI
jgi:hypothetical protein